MGILDKIGSHLDTLKDKVGEAMNVTPIIKAAMMGPRAVGKTSVMASIFSETREQVAGSGAYFRVANESNNVLSTKRLQLMKIFSEKKNIQDEPQAGAIEASNKETTFHFEMGFANRSKTIEIEIQDFPGEYLDSEPGKVAGYVKESQVLMIAIDTPYLMEEAGKYNEEKNKVKQVTAFVTGNPDAMRDKLILFIPLKCERYFHDKRIEDVTAAVKKAYTDIITFSANENIACVVAPIQTLGGVEFDKFVDNTNALSTLSKLSKFRFCSPDTKFQPMFCVQPMYYLLTYVANYYAWVQNKGAGFLDNFKKSLFAMLKDNDKFFYEVKRLSKNIVTDKMGYEIVLNNTILNV